jgi:hypothetical protein
MVDARLTSIKISDARTNRGKRLRVLIHTINMFILGMFFMTSLRILSAAFDVELNVPIRQYDFMQVLLLFGSLLFLSMLWLQFSLYIIRQIFIKIKILII